ncbi:MULTISPECIES: hypothetical protein [Nocardioides]|jgi:hypothetical protein|uniref:Uncharacterized protein n=1 Tax=Nocardioides kribbensis TaxID=305517 RepID=A0ABV1NUH6_9ACTN|nr:MULTISPECIES: hypothetical protein [Nocardioides]MCM3515186.1 hypothetical protein [Nocardioides sp. P86]
MGMMKKMGKLGVAKLIYDEARKPENQARIKAAAAKVQTTVQERRAKRPR